mmetsp:Transcript_60263/g.112597  ORF Transcript_60263/g.112597 Transcript_60263/m.112597 type:complete len:226 (+) Transcript_60263:245-922(+)
MYSPEECCPYDVMTWFETGNTPRRWFLKMAEPKKPAMLWAGFWDGPGAEPERTTKAALFHFRDLMNMTTVHPDTALGRLVADRDDLQACAGDNSVIPNFWSVARQVFVESMNAIGQEVVLIMLNKDTGKHAPRSLQESVLYKYELEQLRWGTIESLRGIVLVDMKGTCKTTLPFFRLNAEVFKVGRHGKGQLQQFDHVTTTCEDCIAPCKLDTKLAGRLQQTYGL